MKTIVLRQASRDRAESYGITFVAETVHSITGPRVHNRHHQHEIQVWQHRCDADGRLVDPSGRPTTAESSVCTSARASVIALQPLAEPERGETLEIGDEIRLVFKGSIRPLGIFRLVAGNHSDPHLERV